MGVADDAIRERAALRASLAALGPDAPTSCGDWTTTDLAVHVALGEPLTNVGAVVLGRSLVARGIRVDRAAGLNARVQRRYRRRGFDWAMARLARPLPKPLLWKPVAAVTLLELWAHHEDVLGANDCGPCASDIDLEPVLAVLIRYQRRVLEEHRVSLFSEDRSWFDPPEDGRTGGIAITSSVTELCRLLSGRRVEFFNLAWAGASEAPDLPTFRL